MLGEARHVAGSPEFGAAVQESRRAGLTLLVGQLARCPQLGVNGRLPLPRVIPIMAAEGTSLLGQPAELRAVLHRVPAAQKLWATVFSAF